jgi:hypothetical protein
MWMANGKPYLKYNDFIALLLHFIFSPATVLEVHYKNNTKIEN